MQNSLFPACLVSCLFVVWTTIYKHSCLYCWEFNNNKQTTKGHLNNWKQVQIFCILVFSFKCLMDYSFCFGCCLLAWFHWILNRAFLIYLSSHLLWIECMNYKIVVNQRALKWRINLQCTSIVKLDPDFLSIFMTAGV